MSPPERLYRIQKLLKEYGVVTRSRFLQELEISLATFKRDLAYLRDRMNAPIEWDADAGGYRLGSALAGPNFELPGLWFNAEEIHALLTMQQLLKQLQPGLLSPHIKPLQDRLQRLLDITAAPSSEVLNRIRLHRVNARHIAPKAFGIVSSAVLGRRRLEIHHYHRVRNVDEIRTLSPQRLTYYRDNWYLDAWCHLRHDIRSFSLDVITNARLLDESALDISDVELDAVFVPGYGIFGGAEVQWAVLRFTPEKARWISRERWHPQQTSAFDKDGYYILRLPYSDDRELVMDILRHMPDVSVLEPKGLRERVRKVLEKSLSGMKGKE